MLLTIDPARLRADVAVAARQRVRQLGDKVDRILETYDNTPLEDRRLSLLYEGLRALSSQLQNRPRAEAVGPWRREWRRYQRRLQACYGALAARLEPLAAPVPALRTTNYGRNVFHFGAALFTLALVQFVLNRTQMVYVGLGFAGWCWLSELARARFPWVTRAYMKLLDPIAHSHEHHKVNSATWYGTALGIISVTADPVAITAAVAVLGVGDPVAGLVGRRFGRTRLAHGRTLEGSLAFVAAGALAAGLALGVFYPGLGPVTILLAALAASALGAVAELVSVSLDDNLTIPLAAALGVMLVLA